MAVNATEVAATLLKLQVERMKKMVEIPETEWEHAFDLLDVMISTMPPK